MTWLPGDAGGSTTSEPAGGSDAVVPAWDRVNPPAPPGVGRVAYCRDHWPPL